LWLKTVSQQTKPEAHEFRQEELTFNRLFFGIFSRCFLKVFDDLCILDLMVLEVLRKSRFIDFSSTASVWPTKKHSVH